MAKPTIRALLLDIGGVLLTNGWDRTARMAAAKKFSLDYDVLNERHHIIFDAFEAGKMSFDDYLDLLIADMDNYCKEGLREFIYEQSAAIPGAIDYFQSVKKTYGLKVFAVNNEARELNEFRISRFGLQDLFDAFISSCYVNVRKPDKSIYKYALDIGNFRKEEVVYIDDRIVFVQAARRLGIFSLQHIGLEETRRRLAEIFAE
ncbi:MAG: HAD-IA family hydrolase [Flavihumibacter sp.]